MKYACLDLSLDCPLCGKEVLLDIEYDAGASLGGQCEGLVSAKIVKRSCECETDDTLEERAIEMAEVEE